MKERWLPLVMLISLVGCAPWTQVGGRVVEDSLKFEAELPAGWMRANNAENALYITRDGALLQYINVQRIETDNDLKHTKKKFAKDMLPQEVAEIELDDVRSNPNVTNFELLENVPATIDGRPGFKLLYTWRTKDGLKLKRLHYGLALAEWVYRVQYQAPVQHYFDRDFETFERVRASLKFRGYA